MPVLGRAYRGLTLTLGTLAGLAIAWLALFVTLDVVMRNLGVGNMPWLLEVSEYVLFAATFLAAPWVLCENAHVRVDFLLNNLSKAYARIINFIADLLGLAISAILSWYGLRLTLESIERGDLIFKELVLPEWPFFAVVVASGLLLSIEFCLRLIRSMKPGDK